MARRTIPHVPVRYRCRSCGNLTRFDVVATRRTKAFHHYSVGGDLTVEEEEVLEERVERVTCRWCGATGDDIEELPVDDAAGAGRAGVTNPGEGYSPRSWTTTLRLRGRSSKSMHTTFCQTPSWSSPRWNGIVTEGPMSAARTWLWPLVSCVALVVLPAAGLRARGLRGPR